MNVTADRALARERDDGDLLRGIAERDQAALVALYQRHGGPILAHLDVLTGDRGLSEEVLQDTMWAVWRQAGSYRGESSVRTWLVGIARRQAHNRLRRKRPRVVDRDEFTDRPAHGPGPEEIALDRAEVGEIAAGIRALDLPYREVLSLVFVAGLTPAEVARVLDVPLGTVRSRMFRARAALARGLAGKGQKP